MKKIKAAVIQQTCGENRNENIEKTSAMVREAANMGCNLILLQELHCTPYFCQTENVNNFDLAETIPGPSTDYFAALAKETNTVIVTSLFERRTAGIYHNTAVVFDTDGSIAGKYRKMHIPDDPGFYEKFYFTPGDLGFKPIQTSVGKLGVLICWDQWYPEAARLMALAGADILLYPTAIGWDSSDTKEEQKRQLDAWVTIQRSHAIANGIHLLTANRIGHENDPSGNTNGIDFWGNSFICGPQGEFMNQANSSDAAIIYAELNLTKSEDVRRVWPFYRDRRIEDYSDITKRFIDQ